MDRLRHEPFARAGFAGEEDGAVGAGHGLDHLEDLEHQLAAPDDFRELMRETEPDFTPLYARLRTLPTFAADS